MEFMISEMDIVIRLVLSALLGSLVGFERERKNWAAGLRTHMLVCVGSTLVMIVSAFGFADALKNQHVDLDPSRMAAQVVSGIGFLGAGSILVWHNKFIKGLTTAASLWAVAAIGLAVGGGLYFSSFVATVIILFILAGIKPLEDQYFKTNSREIILHHKTGALSLTVLEKALTAANATIKQVRIQPSVENQEETMLMLNENSQKALMNVMEELKKMPGIDQIELI